MTGQDRRREQAENSRKRLLTVASKLFFKHGYQGVSINDICAEAGLTKGAFYYHFESKDELYRQLFTPRLDAYLDKHYALDPGACAQDRFLKLAECTFASCKELGKDLIAQNLIALITSRTSNLYDASRTHTRLLYEAIDAAMAEGTFRARLSREGYVMLYSCLLNGFLIKWESASDQETWIDWEDLLRQEISLFVSKPQEKHA